MNFKTFTLGIFTCIATQVSHAQIKVTTYLNEVQNDRIKVEVYPPTIAQSTIKYRMPKMVPGTYTIYDFGRFVHNLEALSKTGKKLITRKLDINTWEIERAPELGKITYWVEDTYDSDSSNFVFEPAGTNFEENKNFVLNTHGIYGYFEGYKQQQYELTIVKPEILYGSTALIDKNPASTTDVFYTSSYMELADSPIMYCVPDTTVLKIGDTDVLISVSSPTGMVKSEFVASQIKEILVAAKDYLGGKLPIQKYAFIIHLFKGRSRSGSSGALEHSYSSMYYLREQKQESIAQEIRDIAAHEFYHIVTPLTIHSEEIGDFDYNNPAMSKHLWLYEGVTEYTSIYVQLKQGLMGMEQYLNDTRNKIHISKSFFNDTIPFTRMSKTCLHENKEQYGNVYQKGALIGFCLDVEIRYLTNGEKGLQDVINQLSKKYGKDKSFKDDELFEEITAMTHPGIMDFFKKYVDGNMPLPLEESFSKIGITYTPKVQVRGFSYGSIAIGIDYPKRKNLFVADVSEINEFGKNMGYQEDDELLSLNGKKITPFTFDKVVDDWKRKVKEGDMVKVKVLRKNQAGKLEKKTLKTKAIMVDIYREYVFELPVTITEKQKKIRNAWLGKNS